MRVTLDIDGAVLRELEKRQTKEGKAFDKLVSDLLARALKEAAAPASNSLPRWIAKPMGARLNHSDKEAVLKVLDR